MPCGSTSCSKDALSHRALENITNEWGIIARAEGEKPIDMIFRKSGTISGTFHGAGGESNALCQIV